MVKITFWFDYETAERFKNSWIFKKLEKFISFKECLAFAIEETEVIS